MQLSDVYTSVPLTQISLAYKPEWFIAEQIAPIVQVAKDSWKIYSYAMDNMRYIENRRAVWGKWNIVTTDVSSADHYVLEDHVLWEFIPEEILENAERPLKPRSDITEFLTQRMFVYKEKALADTVTSNSTYTNYTTLSWTSQWSDYTNSDPFDDIDTAITTVRSSSWKIPNTMIIAWDVLQKLRFHPDIVDRFPWAVKISSDMILSAVGSLFGIDRLLVWKAQYNSADLGQTDTLADIWTKDVVVAYIENSPTLMSRSFAFTYQKKAPRRIQVLGQGQGWLETIQRKSEYIQISDKFQQKLIDEKCAYLIEAAIA